MGLFGFGKGDKGFVDLAERYRKQKEREKESSETASDKSSSSAPFPFFDLGAMSKTKEASEDIVDLSSMGSVDTESTHEKKRKLAKRLADMTSKMEDLGNQIYHLQQRVEVLEKKNSANKF
jgi:hypothetical protein